MGFVAGMGTLSTSNSKSYFERNILMIEARRMLLDIGEKLVDCNEV